MRERGEEGSTPTAKKKAKTYKGVGGERDLTKKDVENVLSRIIQARCVKREGAVGAEGKEDRKKKRVLEKLLSLVSKWKKIKSAKREEGSC